MRQHVGVHGRRQQHRRGGGQVQRRQEIVGDAVRELANGVRGGGHDQQQADVRGDGDVLDVGVGARRPLAGDDAPARDGLEGHLADEPPGVARHQRDDVVPALLQTTSDLDGLVGPDAAGDAECDECHGYSRNVSMIAEATGPMRGRRARSAWTMQHRRPTAGSTSSLITT